MLCSFLLLTNIEIGSLIFAHINNVAFRISVHVSCIHGEESFQGIHNCCAGDVAQWQIIFLVCLELWVQSLVLTTNEQGRVAQTYHPSHWEDWDRRIENSRFQGRS